MDVSVILLGHDDVGAENLDVKAPSNSAKRIEKTVVLENADSSDESRFSETDDRSQSEKVEMEVEKKLMTRPPWVGMTRDLSLPNVERMFIVIAESELAKIAFSGCVCIYLGT